jgi:hypothetical protein
MTPSHHSVKKEGVNVIVPRSVTFVTSVFLLNGESECSGVRIPVERNIGTFE